MVFNYTGSALSTVTQMWSSIPPCCAFGYCQILGEWKVFISFIYTLINPQKPNGLLHSHNNGLGETQQIQKKAKRQENGKGICK